MSVPRPTYVDLPCRAHGGIGDALGCRTCQDAVPPPPGERGRELTAAAALDVLADQFRDMTEPPQLKLSVKAVAVKKLGRWVIVTIKFPEVVLIHGKEVRELSVRMPRARAESVRMLLARVLGKAPGQ